MKTLGYYSNTTKEGYSYTIYKTLQPDQQAQFAMEIIIRSVALCAAKEDGEDSSGRQKLSSLNPEEIVSKAVTIAEKAFERFEDKEWLLKFPPHGVRRVRSSGEKTTEED